MREYVCVHVCVCVCAWFQNQFSTCKLATHWNWHTGSCSRKPCYIRSTWRCSRLLCSLFSRLNSISIIPRCGTADADIGVTSAAIPELSEYSRSEYSLKCSSLHVWNSACLMSALPINPKIFFKLLFIYFCHIVFTGGIACQLLAKYVWSVRPIFSKLQEVR